jgi:hypothetical protein
MAEPTHYVLTDIRVPFWRLVLIFLKWTIAALPAIVLLLVVLTVLWAALFNGMLSMVPDTTVAP